MSVVGNILEQEDKLKGLSNDRLLQEIQNPSGLFLAFLPPSEMQRRNEMRERYEGNQEQPSNTIVEQIVTEGLGGMGPISPQDNSSMLPTGMAPQTMGSPIPTDPNFQPLPVVAAAGEPPPLAGGMALGSAGLGGRGGLPQRVSGGGIVGMQQAGRVPRSKPASWLENLVPFPIGENYPPANKYQRIGRAILDSKGKDWRTYSDDYIESLGRFQAQGFYDIPEDTGIGGLIQRSQEREVALDPAVDSEVPYWKEEDYVPPLDYLDVLGGQSLSPEIAYEQETGRDLDAPTRWDDARARFAEFTGDEERYRYRHLDPAFKEDMPVGERGALVLREGFQEVGDVARTLGPAMGEAVVDAATLLLY